MTRVTHGSGRIESYTYNKVVSPLTFYDGYHYSFTWTEGRKLESVTYNNKAISYQYDYVVFAVKKLIPTILMWSTIS